MLVLAYFERTAFNIFHDVNQIYIHAELHDFIKI